MLDDAYWKKPEDAPLTDYTTTETCPRCNGTRIDPERAWPEDWPQTLAAAGLVR
jgi:hypothetical protein